MCVTSLSSQDCLNTVVVSPEMRFHAIELTPSHMDPPV